MALSPGSRLGPYEIVAPVGAGGMGEVFRARDTRLDRTVAIKVLAPHVAQDPELRERFDREARTIANLTHPHICTLHDVGHGNGLDYLVLEFVEGETLAERMQRGRMPIDLVIQTAIDIADALDCAHRAGIVHRDLKPGNVMLTRSGTKLLDFGLAKSWPIAGSFASGETRSLTQWGTIVGTLQYMAPEQLESRAVDSRTDIFAFGAVLYEMATGRRAFEGAAPVSVIGAILHATPPPIATLQPLAPAALDRIVTRCLAKDPEDRWQSARDVLLALRDVVEGGAPPEPPAATLPARRSPWPWIALVLGVALVGAIVALASTWPRPAPAPAVVRAMIPPPRQARFSFSGDFGGSPVVSADGRAIAFVASHASGTRQLFVRRLDALEATPLAGTENASFPFWSPDGRSIGFFADGRVKRVDVEGGAVVTVCDAPSGRGGTWSRDGRILFTPSVRDGIHQVPASGGEVRPVTRLDPARHVSHRWPELLGDGKTFLYLAIPQDAAARDETSIYVGSLDANDPPEVFVRSGTQPVVAGHTLLFLRDSTLLAQQIDGSWRRLVGEPVPVAHHVQNDPTIWRGVFTAAPGGPLVYQPGEDGGRTSLTLFDRTGGEIGAVGDRDIYFDLDVSPDGRFVAVNRGDPADIWVYEISRNTATRITFDQLNQSLPVWSPDSSRVAYSQVTVEGRGMLAEARADGTDSPVAIYTGDVAEATDWSPDGRYLLVKPGDLGTTPGDIWLMPLADPSTQFPLVASAFAEYHARFSPDGRWVAYVSNESGRAEVYVSAFAAPAPGQPAERRGTDPRRAGRWQVSSAGGSLPRWRGNGTELFYLATDQQLMAARVDGRGTRFEVKDVRPLFRIDSKPVGWRYDVLPDGDRFLVNTMGEEQDAPLVVVLNWTPGSATSGR